MKTPISYYGGKQTLLKHILPLIPKHKLYTEAFCGGAAVLFAKRPADGEVINDISMDITNFYWMAKVYYRDLKQEIEKTLHSRDMHAHAGHILQYPQFFQPVQRAWAVWALCKMSFASMMDGSFGYDFGGGMPKKLRNAKDEFTEWLCARLDNVTIENRGMRWMSSPLMTRPIRFILWIHLISIAIVVITRVRLMSIAWRSSCSFWSR